MTVRKHSNEVSTQTEANFRCKHCAKPPVPFLGRCSKDIEVPVKKKRSKCRKTPTAGRGTPCIDKIEAIEAKARILSQMISSAEGSVWSTSISGRWVAVTPITEAESWLSEITIKDRCVLTATGDVEQLEWINGLLFLESGVMIIDGLNLCRYTNDGNVICFSKDAANSGCDSVSSDSEV